MRKGKLKERRLREGRYLLRSNMVGKTAAQAWEFYLQLVEVDQAFKHFRETWPCDRFFTRRWNGLRRISSSPLLRECEFGLALEVTGPFG